MAIKFVTCSSSDIPLAYAKAHEDCLKVMPVYATIEGQARPDDLGETYDVKEFYAVLRNGIRSTTSQITPGMFEEVFSAACAAGDEVVYVGFSSKLSSTHNSSILAANRVREEIPGAKIYITDTKCASIGLGLLVMDCIKQAKNGKSAEEIVAYIENYKYKYNHWFGVDSLKFLKDGGRISPAVALIGTTLNIKPTLIVDREGAIVPAGKTRGRKKSIAELANKVNTLYDREICSDIIVGHGDSEEDAEELVRQIKEFLPDANVIVEVLKMTIASHVGPGTLAAGFVGKDRS